MSPSYLLPPHTSPRKVKIICCPEIVYSAGNFTPQGQVKQTYQPYAGTPNHIIPGVKVICCYKIVISTKLHFLRYTPKARFRKYFCCSPCNPSPSHRPGGKQATQSQTLNNKDYTLHLRKIHYIFITLTQYSP